MRKTFYSGIFMLAAFSLLAANTRGPDYLTARATGMGGAKVAIADDRLALYGNPAGLNIFRHKAEISFPTLALNYNPNTLMLGLFTGTRIGNFANPGKVDRGLIDRLKEVKGEHINNIVLPEVDVVFRNFGFGVYGSSSLDAVYDAGIYDSKITYSSRTDVVGTASISKRILRPLSLGIGVKYIYRLECPQTTMWGKDIEKVTIGELFGNPQDTLDIQEQLKQGLTFDIGSMYHLGFLRVGAVLKNVAGSIGGEAIDREFDVGAGYWIPQLMDRGLVERVLLAVDIQDMMGDKNFWTKVHAGVEANMPLGALRAGINQGYPTWGFGLNFFVFHLEFADYSRERGDYPGHLRDHNYLLMLRFGF